LRCKGQVLNRLGAWWVDKTRDVAGNHVIGVPDPNVLECIECTPILVSQTMPAALHSMPAMSSGLGPSRGISTMLPTLAITPMTATIGSRATPDLTGEYPRVTCM